MATSVCVCVRVREGGKTHANNRKEQMAPHHHHTQHTHMRERGDASGPAPRPKVFHPLHIKVHWRPLPWRPCVSTRTHTYTQSHTHTRFRILQCRILRGFRLEKTTQTQRNVLPLLLDWGSWQNARTREKQQQQQTLCL